MNRDENLPKWYDVESEGYKSFLYKCEKYEAENRYSNCSIYCSDFLNGEVSEVSFYDGNLLIAKFHFEHEQIFSGW